MFRFLFFAVALPLVGFADVHKSEGNCPNGKQHYRASLRHIESGGIGYDDGYTTLETFLALDPSQWTVTPFLDARGHVFNNGKWAANAGIGLRTLLGNRAYGIYTYYDYRNAGRFNSNQISVGLETLGELFDFRINGYLPVGTKSSGPYDSTFGGFSGNYMFVSQKYKSAMKGSDAEFGFHFGKSGLLDCYAAAGPYYFAGNIDHTWGGKARISSTFKQILTLELSNSYDRIFHNKFQGQISLKIPFAPRSKVKKQGRACKAANKLTYRMLQPVARQEIIVVNKTSQKSIAIDPATQSPYFFAFVDNTSNSAGTYESPYHSLAQAQDHSDPNNIIYIFPGDGTTRGMDSGITLKADQKLWGSGVNHMIQTSQGTISIPAQSSSYPSITNTNIDTEGNAITLATNNDISGFIITSANNDAIYGIDPQSLAVSFCTIDNTQTFAIRAECFSNTSVSITNNQFLNNGNGVSLILNGTSSLVCSDNTFIAQTSVSEVPVDIEVNNTVFGARIENNLFNDNITGSVRFNLNNVIDANISVLNNVITNNGTGAQSSLGSSFVVIPSGTIGNCSILSSGNTFSGNTSNSHYLHTSGAFTALDITASANTITGNGGSALVIATPIDTLTLLATDNIITECNDNGIAVIIGTSTTGNITISNNTITDIGNTSNGIAINRDFSTLNLTLLNNEISRCEGTGIISYASTGIDSLTLNVSGNTINNCQNLMGLNAASGLDIQQYTNLEGSVTSNTLTDNTDVAVLIGTDLSNSTTCLTLTGNDNSVSYLLTNPIDGLFNLSPCDVDSMNIGTISTSGSGMITLVQSCSDATPCPP